MIAYLVVREGANWSDVYRLVPGKTATIGRAPSNQIVLKSERCSRHHAEVSFNEGRWCLRDLNSRNGTCVGELRISGPHRLSSGDLVSIGGLQLAFVRDLSEALPSAGPTGDAAEESGLTQDGLDSQPLTFTERPTDSVYEPTTITHRRGTSRFLAESEPESLAHPRVSRELAQLYRLALEMGASTDQKTLAEVVLNGLFEGTQADSGAILLLRTPVSENAEAGDLQVVASKSSRSHSYHMISTYLSEFVLREKEAVLARDVGDDSRLIVRDSLGKIHATSVICAPIRRRNEVFGLVHVYATLEESPLDPDDLEFTLAVADQLAVALEALRRQQELAADLTQMRDQNAQLRAQLQVESELVGTSPALGEVSERIARVAPSAATVLIRGESGVGKELVARAIHFSSPRHRGAFICLNCAALSETLLESELFGHEKGAFTGATDRKVGKFEAATNGTILLDEIGEMGPHMQAKFLRVLERHPFERVGGTVPIQVDVRVVAATNQNLEKAVREGRFRRDLYFRLRVVEILVPPLRERREDIAILAEHFLDRFRQETGRRIQGFTPAALARLTDYDWPGNVRELKNVVERAVVLARGPVLDVDDVLLSDLFPLSSTAIPALGSESGQDAYRPIPLADLEREQIAAVLEANNWNKSQSSGILGIERSTLDRKIKRYRIVRAKESSAG